VELGTGEARLACQAEDVVDRLIAENTEDRDTTAGGADFGGCRGAHPPWPTSKNDAQERRPCPCCRGRILGSGEAANLCPRRAAAIGHGEARS
jgi:hypothetical protein